MTILQLVPKNNLTAPWLPSSVPTAQEPLHVTVCCAIRHQHQAGEYTDNCRGWEKIHGQLDTSWAKGRCVSPHTHPRAMPAIGHSPRAPSLGQHKAQENQVGKRNLPWWEMNQVNRLQGGKTLGSRPQTPHCRQLETEVWYTPDQAQRPWGVSHSSHSLGSTALYCPRIVAFACPPTNTFGDFEMVNFAP